MPKKTKPSKPEAANPVRATRNEAEVEESIHRLFAVRELPSLGSLESFVKLRNTSDLFVETSGEAIITTTTSTDNLKKIRSTPTIPKIRVTGPSSEQSVTMTLYSPPNLSPIHSQIAPFTIGQRSKDKRQTKGKGKGKIFEGMHHSDLDVQRSRPPMLHRVNVMQWLWVYSTGSRLNLLIGAALFCIIVAHIGFAIWIFTRASREYEHVKRIFENRD